MEYLAPYLEGDNWMVLLAKPLYLGHISMNVLLIGFILLFFGYQYKKDPPQGAYIDKMMFLFLNLLLDGSTPCLGITKECRMEILY